MITDSKILKIMKNSTQNILGKLGYKIVPKQSSFHPNLVSFFVELKKLNLKPKLVFDIGANRGEWTRQMVQVFPAAQYILFEPQNNLKTHVKDLINNDIVLWENIGLSDHSGKELFTFEEQSYSSNFRKSEYEARKKGLTQIEIMVNTIDKMIEKYDNVPNVIKIDAEGLELKILKSARNALKQTDVIFIEVAILASNEMENDIVSICSLMNDFEYSIVQITDLNISPTNKMLWLAEFAFIRKNSDLFNKIKKMY